MTRDGATWWREALADESVGWSLGTFGAVAEFVRDPGEPAEVRQDGADLAVSTGRGGIRLRANPAVVPLAYETPNRDGETWSQAVALCLPTDKSSMRRRTVLTELGPDEEAVRERDRGAILFDIGLGVLQTDICVRTADEALVRTLRAGAGHPLFEPGNPAMAAIVAAGPHRVFLSRFGRAEVFQPIPPPGSVSPEGPHTHVLPKLLRSGRTHAATTPIPDGLVPCAHLFPPNPMRDQFGHRHPFDRTRHDRFQRILERYGDARTVALGRAIREALDCDEPPERFALPGWRHARATLRVVLRQAAHDPSRGEAARRWRTAFDQTGDAEQADDEQPAH